MAQVATGTNVDPKKGGGTKKTGSQVKLQRHEIDNKVSEVQTVLGQNDQWDAVNIERVLEKYSYDISLAASYIMDGNPILTEWQEVGKKSKEPKVKTQDKRNGNTDNNNRGDGSEKRDRSANDKGGDEHKGDKRPPSGKPKKTYRDGPVGEGGERERRPPREPREPREPKANGSPRVGGPRGAHPPSSVPGQKPHPSSTQPSTQSPTHPHPSQQPPRPSPASQAAPPGATGSVAANAVNVATQPTHQQQQQQTQQQQQAAAPRPATLPTTSFTSGQSYSKVLQGKTQPPPQQQVPSAPTSSQTPTVTPSQPQQSASANTSAPAPAAPSASSSSQPTSSAPANGTNKQTDASPSSSRTGHRPSPTAWRPKDTSQTSLSSPSVPPASQIHPSSTQPTPATSGVPQNQPPVPTPASATSVPTPAAAQQPIAAPQQAQPATHQAAAVAAQTQQAATPAQPTQAQQTQQQPAQTAQPTATQAQVPSPISPPSSSAAQQAAKRSSLYIDGGNLRLPPSLQFADLPFQFGSMGVSADKSKDASPLVLNFGTQPTSTPPPVQQQAISQPAPQPIQAPIQTTSPVPTQSHIPAQQAPQPAHAQPVAHHQPAAAAQPAAHAVQHSPHTAQHAHVAQHPAQHVAQPAQPHIPSHLSQQQLHLSGDHTMGGAHLSAPEDIHQMQGGYPSYLPPYGFPMPFGFSGESNPDEALRMRQYYEHASAAYGVTADNSSSPSSVSQQSSQSPPPQSQSQSYPIPSSYYYPPYMPHPYYQTTSPAQFQQFPGYNMYKPYNYNTRAATGYPPNVHASSSPAGQTHGYEDSDYNKYLQQTSQPQAQAQQPNAYNFYASGAGAGAGAGGAHSAASQGVAGQQGAASSVNKSATSFSPSSTPPADTKTDYAKYQRSDSTSFYNMSQPGASGFPHTSHSNFMQQPHLMQPQTMMQNTPTSVYHHGTQPLSTNTVTGQSGGAPRSHYNQSALS